jgi:hypothetical protein
MTTIPPNDLIQVELESYGASSWPGHSTFRPGPFERVQHAVVYSIMDGSEETLANARLEAQVKAQTLFAEVENAKKGPFRIAAPGDKRPARWVRQVITMKIISAK